MYLFPAIDLLDGQVVRLYQGDYDQKTAYNSDPLAQAKLFEQAGATWLHIVDLNGAKEGRVVHNRTIEIICARTRLKLEVGGGIRTESAITQLLNTGADRVILGTAALQNWSWFEQLAHKPDLAGKLVLGLDAKADKLAVSGWGEQIAATPLEVAAKVNGWPLAAIVYTDIATDGTKAGPNLIRTRELAQATDVPIVASGGVGTLDHLRQLRELPIQGAIVGRALYDGAFTIEQAIEVLEK